jgi:hypothetical protein
MFIALKFPEDVIIALILQAKMSFHETGRNKLNNLRGKTGEKNQRISDEIGRN